MTDILQDSAEWMAGENSNDTKKQTDYNKELEKALWVWFCNICSRNLVVSDEMPQEKVMSLCGAS